jgi:hypothetical protein
VLRTRGKLCLLEADASSGLKPGDRTNVLRREGVAETREVGAVRILEFRGGRCAAQIVFETLGDRIAAGDFIRVDPEPEPLSEWVFDGATPPGAPQRKWAYRTLAAGAAAALLGALQTRMAVDSDRDARHADDPAVVADRHARAVKLHRNAAASYGAAGALIAVGAVQIWKSGARPGGRAASLSVAPVAAKKFGGVNFSLSW